MILKILLKSRLNLTLSNKYLNYRNSGLKSDSDLENNFDLFLEDRFLSSKRFPYYSTSMSVSDKTTSTKSNISFTSSPISASHLDLSSTLAT